eukprot:1159460-Pelagomonas_calceolata.AAC.9
MHESRDFIKATCSNGLTRANLVALVLLGLAFDKSASPVALMLLENVHSPVQLQEQFLKRFEVPNDSKWKGGCIVLGQRIKIHSSSVCHESTGLQEVSWGLQTHACILGQVIWHEPKHQAWPCNPPTENSAYFQTRSPETGCSCKSSGASNAVEERVVLFDDTSGIGGVLWTKKCMRPAEAAALTLFPAPFAISGRESAKERATCNSKHARSLAWARLEHLYKTQLMEAYGPIPEVCGGRLREA